MYDVLLSACWKLFIVNNSVWEVASSMNKYNHLNNVWNYVLRSHRDKNYISIWNNDNSVTTLNFHFRVFTL